MTKHCQEAVLEGQAALLKQERDLEVVKVNGSRWTTLFRCRECGAYWEETRDEKKGAYMAGGIPVLRKVDAEYVRSQWGIEPKK